MAGGYLVLIVRRYAWVDRLIYGIQCVDSFNYFHFCCIISDGVSVFYGGRRGGFLEGDWGTKGDGAYRECVIDTCTKSGYMKPFLIHSRI
jgi:hypothetical protein